MDKGMRCMKEYGALSNKLKHEYKKPSKLSEQSIKHADRKCKKARAGKVPFCKKTKKLQGAILWYGRQY